MPADMEMVMSPAVVPKFNAHIRANKNWTNMFDFMFDMAWQTQGRTEQIQILCTVLYVWSNTFSTPPGEIQQLDHWRQTMMLYLPL